MRIYIRAFWCRAQSLRTWHSYAAPVRVLLGKTEGGVRVLIPDKKGLDRGFHDITLLDMADDMACYAHGRLVFPATSMASSGAFQYVK